MNIVHVVNADIRGGAPNAAFALNKALNDIGVNSSMLVQRKFSNNEKVISVSNDFMSKQRTNVRMAIDIMEMKAFTDVKKGRFSFGDIGLNISRNDVLLDADIIHLHWINEGFLSYHSLLGLSMLNKPIVWTLHDMWAFTGGCHYSMGCRRFEESCGNCPYLKLNSNKDFSYKFLFKKNQIYNNLNLSFITCSEWLAKVAKTSFLLKNMSVTPIHNTLDINIYKPLSRNDVRRKYNLPLDKFIILFVALSTTEERKGFKYLKSCLTTLSNQYPDITARSELLIMGRHSEEQILDTSMNVNSVGRINNDVDVAEFYNAADIFIAPSLEDNLPNTVLESLSCGIPVIAFNIGGIPEMVDHKVNGYLAKEKSNEDFLNGILWAFNNQTKFDKIKKNAREKVLEFFNPNKIANEHFSFYSNTIKPINSS